MFSSVKSNTYIKTVNVKNLDINSYNKRIEKYKNISNLFKNFNKSKCLVPAKKTAENSIINKRSFYIGDTQIFLKKRIGSNSRYGTIFLSTYNNNKFAIKLSPSSQYNLRQIILIQKLSKIAEEDINPHFLLNYKLFICNNNLELNNLPTVIKKSDYYITVNELVNGNFKNFLNFTNSVLLLNALQQILISVLSFHHFSGGLFHNDCHYKNFLYLKIKPGGFFHYKIYDKDIYIKNYGYIWIIWDFGLAHTELCYKTKRLEDYIRIVRILNEKISINDNIYNESIMNILKYKYNYREIFGDSDKKFFEELFKNSNKEFKTFQTKPLPQFADVKEQIKKELSQKYKKYANYQENKLSPKVQNQFENDINKEFENLLKETNDYNKEVNKNINKQIEEAKNIIAENNANKIISQYKSMEDINAHITSSYVRELKGYDNIWKQSLEKNNVKNADIILTNKQFELPIMKLVRGLSTGDNELNKQLLPIAKAINDYTNHIFQSIKEVNPLIKEVKGYTGIVTHNRKLINNNSEEWEKFISNNGLMQEPLNADEITEFKELLNKIHKTSAEQLRAYDYSIRRFKFVSPEAEFAYNNQFGNANTLFERLKNVGEVNARRISSIKTLGENQELTISKMGEILKDPEGAQKIANTLFPVTLGHFNNQAQIINAINLSAKASRLTTSTLNPLIQIIKYLPEDMVNLFTNISKDSSILKGIKYMTTSLTKQTPDFIKQMSSLNEFDKRSLKSLVQQLKIANEKAVHKSMGFFEVGGSKADNYGSFLENINSKINGSHLNDTLLRNKAGTTYATLLKNANQDGKLQQYFPTIPPEKLNKFIDKDGYVNPFINNDPKLKKYSEIIANKYFEFIEDVNPVYTKSSIISSPDSPSALLPVKMARWTQTVTSRTLLPLMKEFATTKGISRSGTAGAKWLLYATSMTAISEATRTLEDWIEGKEHETKWKEISKDFLGFGVFGGMYWNYKLSYSKMIDLAKAGYYTTKANLFDKEYSDEQFKDFTNSKKNIDNASYIFRIYHSIHDRFEK